MRRIAFAALMLLSTGACGDSVSGTYKGEGGIIEQMAFDGDKVDMTAMGQTRRGDFKVEDGKVVITTGDESQVLAINDEGCLEGGPMIGTFCKE